MKPEYQVQIFDQLMESGHEFGLKLFGSRALNSLRLEKGFGAWATEFRPIYGPFEAGFERFVDLKKSDFIGREAAMREAVEGPERRLVSFTIDVENADVLGDEPIWQSNNVVGWITSGGYSHHVGQSVALGYIPSTLVDGGENFAIEILGIKRPAHLIKAPLLDPKAERMRG